MRVVQAWILQAAMGCHQLRNMQLQLDRGLKTHFNAAHSHAGKLLLKVGFSADSLCMGFPECLPSVAASLPQSRQSEQAGWKLQCY